MTNDLINRLFALYLDVDLNSELIFCSSDNGLNYRLNGHLIVDKLVCYLDVSVIQMSVIQIPTE